MAAIQNLEFLRRLIEEVRREEPFLDMLKLRMLQVPGAGMDSQEEA